MSEPTPKHRRPPSAVAPFVLVALSLLLMAGLVGALKVVADRGPGAHPDSGSTGATGAPTGSPSDGSSPTRTAPSTPSLLGPTSTAPGVLLPVAAPGSASADGTATASALTQPGPHPSASRPQPSLTPPVTATPTPTHSRGDPQGRGSSRRHTPTPT